MRFTGNIDARLDDKGRVFLPAAFRKILQQEGVEGLILRRDVFQACLTLYPEQVWNQQVDRITQRTDMFDREGRSALRRFVAGVETVTLDSGGRLLIPKRYLEAAGIQGDVRFIGVDNIIEVWSKEAAERLMEEPDLLANDLERIMGHARPEPPVYDDKGLAF